MLKVYPAVFSSEGSGYSVSFPDLKGCLSEGDTLEEAVEMAQDALGAYLASVIERDIGVPDPTPISDIPTNGESFTTLVSADPDKFRRNTRAVKKTLTLPAWLNEMAEQANVNFSGILQAALKSHLNVK